MPLTTHPTGIPGVTLIEPRVFGDDRGFFLETHRASLYADLTGGAPFVQDNLSRSDTGVLRGLHYQRHHPQGKLVYVVRGRILDVVADIRRGSPTFGQWETFELSDANHLQLYIAPGLAHGFQVLDGAADVMYKCTDYYHGDDQCGILWNDPELHIDWGVTDPVLSPQDQRWPTLSSVPKERLPEFDDQRH